MSTPVPAGVQSSLRTVMEPILTDFKARKITAEEELFLKVVILYEDLPSTRMAYRACELLLNEVGRECVLRHAVWKFNALRLLSLRQTAANEAAEADFVVIAGHGQGPLPAEVKAWGKLWQQKARGRDGGLIALFDRPLGQTWQMDAAPSYLENLAQAAQWEFFEYRPEPQGRDLAFQELRRPAPTEAEPSLVDLLSPMEPVPQGGINE